MSASWGTWLFPTPWGNLRLTHCEKSRLRWGLRPMGDPRHSAPSVGFGEASVAQDRAGFLLRQPQGTGFLWSRQRQSFLSRKRGLLSTSSLKGGLGILYILVLSVSCALCPIEGNFLCSGQGGGGHIPRCFSAICKDPRVSSHLYISPSSHSREHFTQPQCRAPKSERKCWLWGCPAGSSPVCPPAPKPVGQVP